jgi:alpha-amylase/alpha-mannosidase (GH57 family)
MTRPLSVALVWHMHQPWYRDEVAGHFALPWVRRRAAKDYLHMLQLLERHPAIRVTMNMVPSLLSQLQTYAEGDASDSDLDLCLRDAMDLTAAERNFLVAGAAHDDYGRRVALLAPYQSLVQRLAGTPPAESTVDEIRDLQVWTLLAWLDPDQIRDDRALLALAERGRGFAEADKPGVAAAQLELLRSVIPAYREAVAAGRVEPMTSPYHHPILPLLIDARSARVAVPDIALAEPALQAPDDAAEQLERGLDEFTRLAGKRPQGAWPPECALSPAAAALLRAAGLRFAVADELVLARTLGHDVRASRDLYRPHTDESGLTLLFRDAELSNLVGFTYQSMEADAAAADLLARLEAIAQTAPDGGEPLLVTIALDGENFKDFYAENATPFLDAVYSGLANSSTLQSTHIGSFLDAGTSPPVPLPALFTGSWVDGDLRTWVGEPAHTRAWGLLGDTRRALLAVDARTAHPLAWDELLVAEASDWFWWFGEHHDSGRDAAWDALFRAHLRNAHTIAGLGVPAAVDEPLISAAALGDDCAPLRAIDPVGAGDAEWRSGGIAAVGTVYGAMRPPASSVERIVYGAGGGRLHLRFGHSVPRFERAIIDAGPAGRLIVDRAARSLSVALPVDGPLDFAITLEEAGRGTERVPGRGTLHVGAGSQAGAGLRVLIVAAECAPLAAAGGLAGLVEATAADAGALGHEVVVVVPHHRDATFGRLPGVRVPRLGDDVPGLSARVVQGALGERLIPVLSVDAPALFDRPGIYGEADDGDRYVAFCGLVQALLRATGFAPDLVHGFEWQTAALLAILAASPQGPATVLGVGEGSASNVVQRAALARVGLAPGEGDVDLLELGRSVATVVESTPRRGPLEAVYAAAMQRLTQAG